MSEAAEIRDELSDEQLAVVSQSEFYRRAERLLWDYPTYARDIAALEVELDNILPGRSRSYVAVGNIPVSAPGDTSEPERWAIIRTEGDHARLVRDRIRYLWTCLQVIEAARYVMTPRERQYVHWRYVRGWPPWKLGRRFGTTHRQIRDNVIGLVIQYAKLKGTFPATELKTVSSACTAGGGML